MADHDCPHFGLQAPRRQPDSLPYSSMYDFFGCPLGHHITQNYAHPLQRKRWSPYIILSNEIFGGMHSADGARSPLFRIPSASQSTTAASRTSTSASELILVITHIATRALICRNDVFTIFASQTLGSYVTCSNLWPTELRLRPVWTVCIQSWHYVLGRFLQCLLFPGWLRLRLH